MNPIMAFVLKFTGQRTLHFIVYAVIGVIAWGVYQKIFVSPTNTTTVKDGGKVVNVYQGSADNQKIPLGGCSTYRVNAEAYWKKPNVISSEKK